MRVVHVWFVGTHTRTVSVVVVGPESRTLLMYVWKMMIGGVGVVVRIVVRILTWVV